MKKVRKQYAAPEIRSQKVECGVFGSYGSSGGTSCGSRRSGRRSWWEQFWHWLGLA